MEQELDILQKTQHPNIVRVIELLEGPVNFYVVMELVTGGDLCGYILKQKKFSERRAAVIVKQILLAVNYMHQQHIVHRDLKPDNILVSLAEGNNEDDVIVKVTDFGFACQFELEDGLTQILGSPLYMAPEIVLGKQYDSKVDIWSLGCIVNIMLTGNAPFYGKTRNEIYKAIVNKEPKFGKAKKILST